MSPRPDSDFDEQRRKVQKDLGDSQHALADGILCLTLDMTKVKNEITTMNSTVSKLYKVVAGDSEFGTEGLIQKDEASKARHKETFARVEALDGAMGKRVEKMETEMTKMKAYGAAIVVGWGLLGEFIKSFFKH